MGNVTEKIVTITNANYILGNAEQRYFGSGYKNTTHIFENFRILNNSLIADLNIKWKTVWARKNGKPIIPHVSSLDFYIVATLLTEHYLKLLGNIKNVCVNKIWVEEFYCKAASQSIDDSLLTCSCLKTSQQKHDNVIVYSFLIKIQNVTANLKVRQVLCKDRIRKCKSICNNSPINQNTNNYLYLGNRFNYHDTYYKQLDRIILNIEVYIDERKVCSDIVLENWTYPDQITGIGTSEMPCLTFGDLILLAGQLSQILIYQLDNITRDNATNLWLREIRGIHKYPVNPKTKACVSIISSNTLSVKGKCYNDLRLKFDFNNGDLVAECKAAYEIYK